MYGTVWFDYSSDRFFEHLFDSLLKINSRAHFTEPSLTSIREDTSPTAPLSIEGVNKLIQSRYKYEKIFAQPGSNPVSNAVLARFIRISRYGRYWHYPIIHLYKYDDEQEATKYFEELVKLTLCYSLQYKKTVYHAHKTIRDSLLKLNESSAAAIDSITENRSGLNNSVHGMLSEQELAWNHAWKSIACRLSEYLNSVSDYSAPNAVLISRLFDTQIDIEHIQAFMDKDGNKREEIWQEWGHYLNGLGNLAMLERGINRSIRNGTFDEKKSGYGKSSFTVIKALYGRSKWELDDCKRRCEIEADKITKWLCADKESHQ